MQNSFFLGFIQNIAILLSFSLIYDYFWVKDEEIKNIWGKILAGLLVGMITILLMMVPWRLTPGITFDTRSIILSISGLFFGPLPTFVAMVIASLYRLYMGGSGTWMGVAVILSSGFIGMIWRILFPPRKIKKPQYNLLLFGLLVHIVMLGCTIFLPESSRLDTFKVIVLPVLLLYVPGTVLIGMLMLKRWQIWQQQKMKEQEEGRYRQLFETAGEAILVAQEGKICFANQRLGDLLGRSYEEVTAQPFTNFIHPDDRDFVLQRHRERVRNFDIPKHYSFRIITGSGDVRWVEINSVLFEWNGEPSSLSFLSDVTSLRETSRQLVLAKNKAEESDRLKTIFLANMSHEIRTPMNAILGFSDLLKTERLSLGKQRHYIGMIQTAGSQLLNIINDIVDISKLEVHQLSINMSPTCLFDIFQQSLELLQNNPLFLEKEEINLILNFPKEYKDLLVQTDPYRIRQVIDNLLNNAVKYTDKGSIELACHLEVDDDRVHMEAHIIDSGSGIPENKKNIIFERFRQAEEDQYREGAGLGLSIAKGIVELLNGKIGFSSETGKGSDFYFTLDLVRIENMEDEPDRFNHNIPDLKGLSVLIAEDDPTSFYLIKEYLRETYVDIEHAKDGNELMNMLEKKVPDLLLLDINMPHKDGFECLKQIREKKYNCKIIAQTAYAMENEKERCMNSGCHGYVTKPLDPNTLFKEIIRVLSN
jgi:PAS domain S-box-containing protein